MRKYINNNMVRNTFWTDLTLSCYVRKILNNGSCNDCLFRPAYFSRPNKYNLGDKQIQKCKCFTSVLETIKNIGSPYIPENHLNNLKNQLDIEDFSYIESKNKYYTNNYIYKKGD